MTAEVAVAGLVGPAAAEARLERAPEWLAERRRAAWDAYGALPMPSSARDEDWRRTDVSKLRPDAFLADPGETAHGDALVETLAALRDRIDAGAALVAATRRGVRRLDGAERLRAQGVTVLPLDEAVVSHAAQVQGALRALAVGESKLAALWEALWVGGCFVHVPRGVEAAVPVVAGFAAAGENAAIFPATVAVLEEGAALTLVEAYASPAAEDALLSDAVTLLRLGDGSRLDHCVVQQWGPRAWHLATHRATLGRDARLRMFTATLGARLQKTWMEALLEGAGGEAQLGGICFGDADQHLDHQSLQAHRAPSTRSDLLLKVAVRDQARSVYSGLIDVDRAAQGTDAYVQNRNLILSPRAKADSIPRLQIRANDVRCSHGATAGHIDDEQRFYLGSRGVPAEEADRLIVRGFMEDALARCPHEGVRELVGELLDEEIHGQRLAGVDDLPGDAEVAR